MVLGLALAAVEAEAAPLAPGDTLATLGLTLRVGEVETEAVRVALPQVLGVVVAVNETLLLGERDWLALGVAQFEGLALRVRLAQAVLERLGEPDTLALGESVALTLLLAVRESTLAV